MGKPVAFDGQVLLDEVIFIIGRAKTRELKKFPDKVGLIEVSAIHGEGRPIWRGILLDENASLLKPLNPAE